MDLINRINKVSKSNKVMLIVAIVFFILFSVIIKSCTSDLNDVVARYKKITDGYKEKCLSKFKTIEYEVVSDVLYCKTDKGLVKFK